MGTISNEEKAKDITKCLWFPQKCTESDIQKMLIAMAEWKDEQFAQEKQLLIKKACKWLKDNIENYYYLDEAYEQVISSKRLVEDLAKAMEE